MTEELLVQLIDHIGEHYTDRFAVACRADGPPPQDLMGVEIPIRAHDGMLRATLVDYDDGCSYFLDVRVEVPSTQSVGYFQAPCVPIMLWGSSQNADLEHLTLFRRGVSQDRATVDEGVINYGWSIERKGLPLDAFLQTLVSLLNATYEVAHTLHREKAA